jgi:hypothetical protein
MSVSVVNIVVVLSLVFMLFVTANKAARESRNASKVEQVNC